MWHPKEIIIHEQVKDDPVTRRILRKCPRAKVCFVDNARSTTVTEASGILKDTPNDLLTRILAGKQVLFIAKATGSEVDRFHMPDARYVCPAFDRLKLAANGCCYQCDWCYLKMTYRSVFPFITVKAEYPSIAAQIDKRLGQSAGPVIFNSGEMADSLALEHLTGAARWFIPWFAEKPHAYLYMLTKSDHVDGILNLPHNGHTIMTWSLNHEAVSRKFEIGAPPFAKRLEAARKVQQAGYPLRIRLDPIVPMDGWKDHYRDTIEKIFRTIAPERVTLGTLRFEEGFFRQRRSIFKSGPELTLEADRMKPMFPPERRAGRKKPAVGKYSYDEEKRTEIFSFAVREIQKYSDCRIALCKESARVWENVGLPLSRCACVCQLDEINMDAVKSITSSGSRIKGDR